MGVLVHSAEVHDSEGGEWIVFTFARQLPRLVKVVADQGYRGAWRDEAQAALGVEVEIVKKLTGQSGFVVLPLRWRAERSIAWLNRNRRLSKDYEHDIESSEAWIYLAAIHHLLKRLHPDTTVRRPYASSKRSASAA